jgi:hypothetical protein
MARAQRNNSPTPASGDILRSRRVPVILSCPVCDVLLGDIPVESHLLGHMPTVGCLMCTQHARWVIDWDSVAHPHTSHGLYYCNPCGRYAPVTRGHEPAASLQGTTEHTENRSDTLGNTDDDTPAASPQ